MKKSVKEVLDEYSNRVNKNVWDYVRFEKSDSVDGYMNVTNVVRDGVKLTELKLDHEMHEYAIHTGYCMYPHDKNCPIEWADRTFYGKIIEFEKKIEG